MCKKCIVFGRVSSSHQDFTAQINRVKAEALKDNYTKDEIVVVQGKESAIKKDEEERQTLNEMKQIIEDNPSIESVYCFAIDRLARRVSIILSVKDYLLTRGINLVFLLPRKMETIRIDENGNKVEDELTKLLLMLLAYGAEMEMKVKIERAVTKKTEMKENNEVTSKLLFGYINVNRHAQIDYNKTAPILKWIFKSYNEDGKSLVKIYDEGVELGYWNNLQLKSSKASRIRQKLINYAYCGEPTTSGFVYPKLIEKEEIDKAIELMQEARIKPKTVTKVIALAKGKIKDKKSGYSMVYDGNHLKYFLRGDVTNGKQLNANLNVVDFLVWREASRVKWNLLANKDDNTRTTVGKELDEVDDRIYNIQQIIDTEVTTRFNKLYKAYINSHGRISDADYEKEVKQINKEELKYKKQIESLEQKKVELRAILTDLNNKDSKVIDPMQIMNITDYQHQKEIVDEVIDRIEVEKTELGQMIYIFNKIESKPQRYMNQSKTRHKVIYQILNDDMDAIDISEEYKPRYKRTNK